ncbi:MAG: tripartite tricarboxylate transporter TctB family protein [Burkholderiales bacterium]|jgi:putative tricarboxylic transport membrane protein|nr:tripartite tricarboxylate transporter TctB family protein [Burkholderiales bacterium]
MGDRILGALCVLLAGAMAWAARGYVAEISYEPVGPRAFPTLLAAVLGLAGAWLALRPSRTAAPAPDAAPATPHSGLGLPLALTVGAMLAYALLFQWLGFVLATALMALPVGRSFGGRPLPLLATGLGLGLGLYFVFDKLFDVVLPTGVLSFVLGGR